MKSGARFEIKIVKKVIIEIKKRREFDISLLLKVYLLTFQKKKVYLLMYMYGIHTI